jgi:PAS domain S-box-containing protein
MNTANQKKRRRQQVGLYLTGLALLTTLLFLMGAMAYLNQQFSKISEDTKYQSDLNLQLRQVQLLSMSLYAAESSQRGYLLTGDPAYLEPFIRASAQFPALLEKLDSLAVSHPEVNAQISQAKEALEIKIPELHQTVRLYQAGQRAEALEVVDSDVGMKAMTQAISQLDIVVETIRRNRNQITAELLASGDRQKAFAYIALWVLEVGTLLAIVQIVLLLRARTRYEKDLAHSEARYRTIVEEQSELVSLATAEGIITYANPAYARHFATTPEHLVGHNLFDHVEPSDVQRVKDTVDEVLRSGATNHGENRMQSPDGREMWVAWTNSLQVGDDGQRLLHSVGRDITAQKLAQRAQRHSEEFLVRTGRVGGVGGWEIDLASGEVKWSDQVRKIHEVDQDFVPTLESVMLFFPLEARDQAEAAGTAAVLSGTPYDLELPLVTAKNREICVRLVGEVEVNSDGRPVRLVGALQDITERKKLQDQLREKEQFLREVTDNVPIALAFSDLEGRYKFVNEALAKRLGRPREEILGRTRVQITDTTPEFLREKLDGVLEGKIQNFVVQEAGPHGTRLIQTQLLPALDRDAKVKGFYSTGVDITDLKKTEQQLRELTEIFENTPDLVIQTDPSGRVQYLNPSAREALQLPTIDTLEPMHFADFCSPETKAQIAETVIPIVRKAGVWVGETTVLKADGEALSVNQLVIAHRGSHGRLLRFSAVMRDISEAVKARLQLERQTSTLESIIEAIPALVAVFDKEARYRLVNREFERQRRLSREQIIGHTVEELFGRDEWLKRRPQVERVLQGETLNFERADEHSETTKYVNVTYIPLRLPDGAVDGFIAVAQDITSHREE